MLFPIIIFAIWTVGSLIVCIYTTWGNGYTDDYYLKWAIPVISCALLLLAIFNT